MKNELEKVMSGRDMTENEMNMLANSIIQGELSEVQIASFLVALKMKGEAASELTGLARALQKAAIPIPTNLTNAMDNCGTGGDRSFSFNISTTAAFVDDSLFSFTWLTKFSIMVIPSNVPMDSG